VLKIGTQISSGLQIWQNLGSLARELTVFIQNYAAQSLKNENYINI